MANLIKKLESGAQIEIQMAEFEKAHRLLQVVTKSGIPIEAMVDLIVDEKIQPALWDCMAVCLYNGIKVSRETFESTDTRGDYLVVAKEALVYNLSPFFKGLASRLNALAQAESGKDLK